LPLRQALELEAVQKQAAPAPAEALRQQAEAATEARAGAAPPALCM